MDVSNSRSLQRAVVRKNSNLKLVCKVQFVKLSVHYTQH